MTNEEQVQIVYRLLKAGIGAHTVADAMDLEFELVETMVSQINVNRFGTDDITEGMTFLIWEALDAALHEIRYGPPASKFRYMQLVLSRSIGLAGKSSPETSEKIRSALDEMARGMSPVAQLTESIYTPTE